MNYTLASALALALGTLANQAQAADDITLKCNIPAQEGTQAYSIDILAAPRGITVTKHIKDENGVPQTLQTYTANNITERIDSYYRLNDSEIAWGTTNYITNVKQTWLITRQTGTFKADTTYLTTENTRPTEIGDCKPDSQ